MTAASQNYLFTKIIAFSGWVINTAGLLAMLTFLWMFHNQNVSLFFVLFYTIYL